MKLVLFMVKYILKLTMLTFFYLFFKPIDFLNETNVKLSLSVGLVELDVILFLWVVYLKLKMITYIMLLRHLITIMFVVLI
jgi:hypothetical protein